MDGMVGAIVYHTAASIEPAAGLYHQRRGGHIAVDAAALF